MKINDIKYIDRCPDCNRLQAPVLDPKTLLYSWACPICKKSHFITYGRKPKRITGRLVYPSIERN